MSFWQMPPWKQNFVNKISLKKKGADLQEVGSLFTLVLPMRWNLDLNDPIAFPLSEMMSYYGEQWTWWPLESDVTSISISVLHSNKPSMENNPNTHLSWVFHTLHSAHRRTSMTLIIAVKTTVSKNIGVVWCVISICQCKATSLLWIDRAGW